MEISLPALYPPRWINQPLVLYHGTLDTHAGLIVAGGISVARGRRFTDFGPGFYTTTVLRQAVTWANQLSMSRPGNAPAVIELRPDRDHFARLQVLEFVRGGFDADDFWSFIHYCRSGATDHGRPGKTLYDVVVGPVAASWRQRLAVYDADQFSFHTPSAETRY